MAATKKNRVQALRKFTYSSKVGKVFRGQVFDLGGHVNDKLLLEQRAMAPWSGSTVTDSQGREFVSAGAREAAGNTDRYDKMTTTERAEARAAAMLQRPLDVQRQALQRRVQQVGS